MQRHVVVRKGLRRGQQTWGRLCRASPPMTLSNIKQLQGNSSRHPQRAGIILTRDFEHIASKLPCHGSREGAPLRSPRQRFLRSNRSFARCKARSIQAQIWSSRVSLSWHGLRARCAPMTLSPPASHNPSASTAAPIDHRAGTSLPAARRARKSRQARTNSARRCRRCSQDECPPQAKHDGNPC